jgi:hypothetical protein
MRKRGSFAAAMVTAAALAIAGTAQASVTIGSNLAGTGATNMPGCNNPCTATNLVLPASSVAPNGLLSPVNGTVTSWRARANTGLNLSLQVVRPVSGITYTGVATSVPASFTGPDASGPFGTSLPIKAGDGIGLLSPNGNLIIANTIGGAVASWFLAPAGPLADGSTRAADVTGGNAEVLVQATVEPANNVSFGAVSRNKKKGTATVKVSLPNAGKVDYSGNGVAISGPANVTAAGEIDVFLKATGKKLRKLRKKGKAGASLTVTFTPTNGVAGSGKQDLQLKKKLKKK